MKKDINIPLVKNVTLAVAKKNNEDGTEGWSVYLINRNDFPIENTLVASRGYGKKNGEEQKTSTLRHFLETVGPNSVAAVEMISPEVFHLNNEYWVTYYIDKNIYDKKFIFLPHTINDGNTSYIQELQAEGVLHS